MPHNIELKVACTAAEYASIRSRLTDRPLRSLETIRQTDLYFVVPGGRLKLRTVDSGSATSAELIQYQRADQAGARVSTYRRIPVAIDAAAELERALREALGVLTCVRKERTVGIWRSTRIHLDQVVDLGSFVELETVLSENLSHESGRAEFEEVVEWLGLASLPSLPCSYSDLLLMKGQRT